MHNLSSALHNLNLKFKIDIKERRKQVASLLSRSVSETEIARQLGVDQVYNFKRCQGIEGVMSAGISERVDTTKEWFASSQEHKDNSRMDTSAIGQPGGTCIGTCSSLPSMHSGPSDLI